MFFSGGRASLLKSGTDLSVLLHLNRPGYRCVVGENTHILTAGSSSVHWGCVLSVAHGPSTLCPVFVLLNIQYTTAGWRANTEKHCHTHDCVFSVSALFYISLLVLFMILIMTFVNII